MGSVVRKEGHERSLLGFGCMRLPTVGGNESEIDRDASFAMFDYAWKHGVNYFDTAYPYHQGKSELIVGEALQRYPRESFFLADKMPTWLLKDLQDGKRIFEEQLQKCRVGYFDYYLCHSVGDSIEEFEKRYEKTGVLDYLTEEKKRGGIRHLGFSFHGTPDVLEKLARKRVWDFVQIQLNYLDWDMQNAKKQYAILTELGIPVTVMEPVRGGSLCRLCPEAVGLLKKEHPEKSLASWAIRFAASLPNVVTVLSGMSAMDQVEDNVATMTDFEPVSDREKEILGLAVQAYLRAGAIPCTGCRYCAGCPAGVDIPQAFAVYNKSASENGLPLSMDSGANAESFRRAYGQIPEDARPDRCKDCGRCVKLCPQKIEIPRRLREIVELAANL